MNKMVILEAKLHKNRISVHKILIFVVKMCKNGLRVLEAKFSCGGHQTFSAGMVKKGGTWRTLGVPDWRHGGQDHFWRHEWFSFTPRKIPWTCCVDITIRSLSERGGVKKVVTWLTLRVPDQRHGWLGYSWCHEGCSFILRNKPWKFRVDISMESVSGRGGHEGGYLEDIESSWPKTWRSWSFLTWMMFFYQKEDTLKILCWYLN